MTLPALNRRNPSCNFRHFLAWIALLALLLHTPQLVHAQAQNKQPQHLPPGSGRPPGSTDLYAPQPNAETQLMAELFDKHYTPCSMVGFEDDFCTSDNWMKDGGLKDMLPCIRRQFVEASKGRSPEKVELRRKYSRVQTVQIARYARTKQCAYLGGPSNGNGVGNTDAEAEKAAAGNKAGPKGDPDGGPAADVIPPPGEAKPSTAVDARLAELFDVSYDQFCAKTIAKDKHVICVVGGDNRAKIAAIRCLKQNLSRQKRNRLRRIKDQQILQYIRSRLVCGKDESAPSRLVPEAVLEGAPPKDKAPGKPPTVAGKLGGAPPASPLLPLVPAAKGGSPNKKLPVILGAEDDKTPAPASDAARVKAAFDQVYERCMNQIDKAMEAADKVTMDGSEKSDRAAKQAEAHAIACLRHAFRAKNPGKKGLDQVKGIQNKQIMDYLKAKVAEEEAIMAEAEKSINVSKSELAAGSKPPAAAGSKPPTEVVANSAVEPIKLPSQSDQKQAPEAQSNKEGLPAQQQQVPGPGSPSRDDPKPAGSEPPPAFPDYGTVPAAPAKELLPAVKPADDSLAANSKDALGQPKPLDPAGSKDDKPVQASLGSPVPLLVQPGSAVAGATLPENKSIDDPDVAEAENDSSK